MTAWKIFEVRGYKGTLEVSDNGRVRRMGYQYEYVSRCGTPAKGKKPDKELSLETHCNGYLVLAVYVDKIRVRNLVHRLVATAFVPGYFEGAHVNHINGDKTDNRAANLEWVTNEKNVSLSWETGLVNLRGVNNPGAKLNDDKVVTIRSMLASGMSKTQIAEHFDVSNALISKIERGLSWKHVK